MPDQPGNLQAIQPIAGNKQVTLQGRSKVQLDYNLSCISEILFEIQARLIHIDN